MTPLQREHVGWVAGGTGLLLAAARLWWLRGDPDSESVPEPLPARWDYWFADVPFAEDPTQSKDRPVLVLAVTRKYVLALKVSSQDKSSHHDWVRVDTSAWDLSKSDDFSWLSLDDVQRLGFSRLRRLLGQEADAEVCRQVKRRHLWSCLFFR